MPWQNIHGHDEIVERFQRSLQRGRLGSTFLFVGPPGIGKRLFALKLAQALLCERHPATQLDPCGVCPSCQQVAAGTHPDLEQIARPEDRAFIPIDLLIGDKQHRMREGLCPRMAMRPARGRRKVAIIDDADHLNAEGANCLLKTLEEPPPGSVLVLIGTSPQRQLPTIRSRCQIVRFQPLDEDLATNLVVATNITDNEEQARRLSRAAGGSLSRAAEFADDQLWQFRDDLYQTLATPRWHSLKLAVDVNRFVEAAGTDAPPRRQRLRHIIEMTMVFYRALLNASVGRGSDFDADWQLTELARAWQHDVERVLCCIDRCLIAMQHVDANAHVATCIDAWIDDLAGATRGEGVAI